MDYEGLIHDLGSMQIEAVSAAMFGDYEARDRYWAFAIACWSFRAELEERI
jgi:hypothetical protein